MVNTTGMMDVFTKDIGKITTCMGKASTNGLMAESTKENTLTIKKKVMVSTFTQMEDLTKDNGTKESSTVMVYLYPLKDKREGELGRMAKG